MQWVEELVGGTKMEMASVDKFLKKLSCEEERGAGFGKIRKKQQENPSHG